MQTLKNLPQEGQQAIAQSLGYNGNLEGFPKYLMSNPSVAQEYTALEDAFQKHQQFTQMNKKMPMAQGGYTMDRFEQNQQQDSKQKSRHRVPNEDYRARKHVETSSITDSFTNSKRDRNTIDNK